MKQIPLGGSGWKVPAIVVGCMRLGELDTPALGRFIHTALENGANYFDHADIYGGGACENISARRSAATPPSGGRI